MKRYRVSMGLLALAAMCIGVFLAVDLFGWRADTAFLSGNLVDERALGQGAIYVFAWFSLVLVAPVAAAGGAIAGFWEWASPAR